ncbi:1,4-butanediol diacrylate esterase, putative [Candida dubliniensis CD36]|uniref:1,4-butanediol diacrylate esterase, putative n=1 Tax=Candida dubliniensis (strain CD36 / ATCC MYA-646 / CBS 7987 / NCPF 3949 / NRRL Y-17841) TaxID=573826 RepID=B9WF82_CANDC|nr:1,4-butanediol diacrylate esterase, putative [Candida dubliniensis CD36]CAX41901.1 1,4-butanediol diacrylate esterase, putative [Candida dubliniensis CD36]
MFTSKLADTLDGVLTDITTFNGDSTPQLVAPGCTLGVTDRDSTVYLNSKGVKNIEDPQPVTNNDSYAFFSCTKSMTVMGALILYEQGKLQLDVPVARYFPEIANIGVLEPGAVDKYSGKLLKPLTTPQTPITAKHLITHTAGFSYGFISPDYFALITKGERIDAINPPMEFFHKKTPLIHEPGTDWAYGHNIDWLGFVLERISGQKLGEFLAKYVFEPIGMSSCTFHKKEASDLVRLHFRKSDETLVLLKKSPISLDPILDLGGQGCFGSVGDYLKFIRVWLNYGVSPDSGKRILNESTVKFAIRNHLPEDFEFDFIGLSHNVLDEDERKNDGWTLTGNAYGSNDLPTGRPKGANYWSGVANLHFWIDFDNGIGGFYAVQVLPFMDEYNIESYARFESEVYKDLRSQSKL